MQLPTASLTSQKKTMAHSRITRTMICRMVACFVMFISLQTTAADAPAGGGKAAAEATICLACVSYNRLELLQTTLRSITEHLDNEEKHLRYSLAWVDNGSKDKETLQAIAAEFPGIRKVWNEENQGLASALNVLFFELCTEPYIVTLEEDWGYHFEEDHWFMDSGRKVHVYGKRLTSQPLSLAIEMMKYDQNTPIVTPQQGAVFTHAEERHRPVLGVVLRPETFDMFLDKTEEVLPLTYLDDTTRESEDKPATIKAYRYCMQITSGYAWGSYTNGPTLYSRERLIQLGRFYGTGEDELPDPYSESNFAFRAGRMFCLRVPQVRSLCEDASGCNAVFRHLGYAKSTKHSHRSKIDKERGLEWIVFGTELYDVVRGREEL